MFTINTIEDLIQILDEKPEWVDALRARLLTPELLDLPEKFTKFVANMDAFVAKVDAFVAKVDKFIAEMNAFVAEMNAFVAKVDKFIERPRTSGWSESKIDKTKPKTDWIGSTSAWACSKEVTPEMPRSEMPP